MTYIVLLISSVRQVPRKKGFLPGVFYLLCVKSVYCRIYSLKSCITRSISSMFWREYSRAL